MMTPGRHGWKGLTALMVVLLCAACASKRSAAGTGALPQPWAGGQVTAPARRLSDEERLRLSYYYQEAFKHKQAERHSAAYALYNHCLDIDPEAPEALFETGLYLLYLRREEEGLQRIAKAAEREPENEWYKEALASYYVDMNDAEHAIPVLEDLARLCPTRTDVLSQLMRFYARSEQYGDALRVVEQIETLEGKNEQLSQLKCGLYIELKDDQSAIHELEELAAEHPEELGYKVLIGNQYLLQGKEKEALDVYHEVERVDPVNPALQEALLSYYKRTNNDAAYANLRDTLLYGEHTHAGVRANLLRDLIMNRNKIENGKAEVDSIFGRILGRKQKSIDILALYAAYLVEEKAGEDTIAGVMKRVLEVEPDNRTALFQLLQYYGNRKETEALADVCRQGINHYPDRLVFYFYLGFAYYQDDRIDDALDALADGTKQVSEDEDPGLVSDLYSMMGDLYYKKGKEKEAFAAYDSCLAYRDDNVMCLNNYAYYLSLQKRDLDKAEEMSYRTIKAEPDNPTYLDTYAWILFIKKRYAEARIYIDKVLAVGNAEGSEPISGVLWEHAGDIYYHCGEREQALKYWLQARKAGEHSPQLLRKIKLKQYVE